MGLKRVFSEEHRRRLSEAATGKKRGPRSEADKKAISEAKRGQRLSAAHRAKLSEAGKGRVCTTETRQRLSDAKKGVPLSDLARLNMSRARAGMKLSEEHRRNIGLAGVGRVQSDETKAKRALSLTPEVRAKMADVTAARNKARVWSEEARLAAAIRVTGRLKKKSDTRLEREVERRLVGLDFMKQAKIDGDPRHVWDFVLPQERVLIEADGCYWHGCSVCGKPGIPANQKSDAIKNKVAARLGWQLLRVRECEVQSFSFSY